MKTPRTIAAILKYNRLARLVGSGWHHLDRYWESDTDIGREYHRAGVVATIRQFKSQTCGAAGLAPAVEMVLPAGARENATDGTNTRIEEATAALCDCVDFLNRNRPGAARYLFPLILAAAIAVSGVAYAALTVLLLCSNKGLKVSYFKGRQFDKKAMVWTERKVFMDYGGGRPSVFCPADDFSALWEGVLLAPKDDDYSFFAQSIGGFRLVIDDVVVIDDWDEHGWLPGKHGRKRLTAGAHRIRIDYYHARGNAALRLRWSGGGVPSNTVLGGEYLRKR